MYISVFLLSGDDHRRRHVHLPDVEVPVPRARAGSRRRPGALEGQEAAAQGDRAREGHVKDLMRVGRSQLGVGQGKQLTN